MLKVFFSSIKKYLLIYKAFMKNCIMAQMEYRFNFFISFFLDCAFLATRLVYVLIINESGIEINGWTSDGIILHIGVFTMLSGIYALCFVNNFFKISDYVRTGELDIYITKPISSQFMTTMRYVDFGMAIPDFFGGIIIVAIAWKRLNLDLDILTIMGFIGLLLCSSIVMYAIFLLPHVISFWIIKNKALKVISDSLFEFNNMPMIIYNKILQVTGIFILPIFTIANFPSMFLLGKLNGFFAIWAIVVPIISMLVIRLIWKKGMMSYTSTGS